MKKTILFFVIIFLISTLFSVVNAQSSSDTKIKNIQSVNWQLDILDIKEGLEKASIVGGKLTAKANEGEEFLTIEGTLKPTQKNVNFVVKSDDFKLLTEKGEIKAQQIEFTPKGGKDLLVIKKNSSSKELTKLSSNSFPTKVFILFYFKKSNKIAFALEDSKQLKIREK